MKKCILPLLLSLFLCQTAQSQGRLSYYTPTYYFGLFSLETTSTRASGMGRTYLTLDGIDHAFYNPASIGLTKARISTHVNYANGGQTYLNSHFPFGGMTYRINEKLNIGISGFKWIDSNTL